MTDNPQINVAQADVHVDAPAAPAIPVNMAAMALPDHAIRYKAWFQAFDRLWRPATGWVACPVSILYAFVIAPAVGHPLNDGLLVALCSYSAGIYGIKTFEKTKGVA